MLDTDLSSPLEVRMCNVNSHQCIIECENISPKFGLFCEAFCLAVISCSVSLYCQSIDDPPKIQLEIDACKYIHIDTI